MVNEHMKRYSTSLTREMQIKTQQNIISDPLGWSLSKNKQKITSADKDVEKLELLVGMYNDIAAVKNSMIFPQKT